MKFSYPKGISKEEKRKIELQYQKLMLKSAKELYRAMKRTYTDASYLNRMKDAIERLEAKIEKLKNKQAQ